MLSEAQIERYSRQIILPQLGGKGQEKLLQAKILVNGSGPLQAMALLYLAAAGVGTIGVRAQRTLPIFSAFVETSGEQIDTVEATLSHLNPDCTVVRHHASAERSGNQVDEAASLIQAYDLVLSEPDPLLGQWYIAEQPLCCSWGRASSRHLFVCRGGREFACLECLQTPPEVCAEEGGIFDMLADLFWGAFQVTEALKCVIGLNAYTHSLVFQCQFPELRFSDEQVDKDPDCSVCRYTLNG